MQNNNLFKLFENKGPIVNNLVKDLKKIQLVNPMQFAQIKDGAEKELHSNLLKDRVNGENVPQIRSKYKERELFNFSKGKAMKD